MRNSLRSAATVPAILLSIAGVVGIIAGGYSIRASLTTTGSVTAAGSINVQPGTAATGFDAGPAGPDAAFDGDPGCCWDAAQPVPVVTAGSVSVLESAWDIDDKVARTIGWRLRTEGAAGDSSNAPATALLIQSTTDNVTWATRARLLMSGMLYVTNSISTNTGVFAADIQVNGEDITCDSASAATVFNTNATSGAMFGAATGNLDIGGGSGSTGATLACGTGALTTSGALTFGGAATSNMSLASGFGMVSAYIVNSAINGVGVSGDGLGFKLQSENAAGTPSQDIAKYGAYWTDATAGSEDSSFVVLLRTAGAALANAMTLTAGALTITGDIEAAGGYRMPWAPVSAITDVPASGTMGVGLPMIAVRAGSMTGLGVALGSTAITAGTVSCRFMLDGAAVTGHDVTFSSADAANAVKVGTIAKGEHTFTAGQLIGLACVGSADLAPDNTVDLTITGEMEQ